MTLKNTVFLLLCLTFRTKYFSRLCAQPWGTMENKIDIIPGPCEGRKSNINKVIVNTENMFGGK